MLGWRKLTAWFLVFALAAAASLVFKYEIPLNNIDLVKWVTAFFFGANALEHMTKSVSLTVGPPK